MNLVMEFHELVKDDVDYWKFQWMMNNECYYGFKFYLRYCMIGRHDMRPMGYLDPYCHCALLLIIGRVLTLSRIWDLTWAKHGHMWALQGQKTMWGEYYGPVPFSIEW